jgi:hypothetical protein
VGFDIVRRPVRLHKLERLKEIMAACIILHNMIVEDERDLYLEADDFDYEQINESPSNHHHMSKQLNFWILYKITNVLEIEKFILNSSWILLSIYGKYRANKNF